MKQQQVENKQKETFWGGKGRRLAWILCYIFPKTIRQLVEDELAEAIHPEFGYIWPEVGERLKKAYTDGGCHMVGSIRASLRDYPNASGDSGIMVEVSRLIMAGGNAKLIYKICPKCKGVTLAAKDAVGKEETNGNKKVIDNSNFDGTVSTDRTEIQSPGGSTENQAACDGESNPSQ